MQYEELPPMPSNIYGYEGGVPVDEPPPSSTPSWDETGGDETDPNVVDPTDPRYSDTGDPNSGPGGPGTSYTGTDYPGSSGSSFSSGDLLKFLSGNPALSGIAKVLGAVGMGKLADKLFDVQKGPGGYKGGIPTLTAYREQLPIPTTMQNASGQAVPRRPGSGGISYFSPMQYLAPGQAPTPVASTEPKMAAGGIANLGGYSDGGRLLRGPGDGVSDSIPAMIGKKQPARLADGEFVIPARIVSELGNGSTEAGARKLYAMMDRIKKARGKAKNIAADTKSEKHLPA
jgi:hypothetical protein